MLLLWHTHLRPIGCKLLISAQSGRPGCIIFNGVLKPKGSCGQHGFVEIQIGTTLISILLEDWARIKHSSWTECSHSLPKHRSGVKSSNFIWSSSIKFERCLLSLFKINNFKTASEQKAGHMAMSCRTRKMMWHQFLKSGQLITQGIKLLKRHPDQWFCGPSFFTQQLIAVANSSRRRRRKRVPPTPDNRLQNSKGVTWCPFNCHH